MMGGELHMPLMVCGRLPVLVGAQLMFLLMQQADIGLLLLGLLFPLLLLLVVVVLWLLVGG
jgi:hypothetical protein